MEQGLSNKGLPRSKRMWHPSSSVPILRYSASPEFTTVRLLSFPPTSARTLHCHGLRLRIQRHDCRRRKTSSGVLQGFYRGQFPWEKPSPNTTSSFGIHFQSVACCFKLYPAIIGSATPTQAFSCPMVPYPSNLLDLIK